MYSDIVSWATFILSTPFIITKALLTSIPTLTFVIASKYKFNRFASINLKILLGMSYAINTIEKYWIYLWSILLYPFSYSNYQNNKKIIEFLRANIDAKNVKYNELPNNIRDAIEKEGIVDIITKMIMMFSILPTYRHAFLNNPFLFKYEMYLTNQETKNFTNIEKMCKIVFSYIGDPTYDLKEEQKIKPLVNIGNIGFTPNYYNNKNDHIKNFNNIGMQVAGKYTTFIYLETTQKSPEELLKAIENNYTNNTIMHKNHPIYNIMYNTTDKTNIVHNVPFSDENRYQFLDLVVPYDDLYHVVTGKVEANIRNNNVIEHPMFCLYHNGSVMVYTWNCINDLFTNHVMKYLNSLE